MTTTTGRPRSRRTQLAIAVPSALVLLALLVLAARLLRGSDAGQSFLASYPGAAPLPEAAPVGLPAWLGWQHFLNMFLMVLIIRTGWLVRTTRRPAAHWTARKPGPLWGRRPQRISMDLWLHLSLDVLWLVNGLVFAVLIVVTGHWMRIVPTSWEVLPNAASAALQYLSLDWPTESGWANYNALQQLAYFTTVFLAAPLAAVTGLRMSPAWRLEWRLSRVFPVEVARKVHFPVMVYFVLFVVGHVVLVMTTGALRNLNAMYAARDEVSWVGFGFFAASLAVTVAAWVLARPMFLSPIASLTGKVTR